MKKFISEFKEFISRGNVIDLAVGIIIGSAFTSIVNSLVNQVIMPAIGFIIGKIDFTGLKFPSDAVEGEAAIMYGAFIQQVINFLIIAFVVFCMVKMINKLKRIKAQEMKEKAAETPPPSAELQMLTEIRDLLKESNSAK
ncbi:large-conductance mechanosensitive channel protein MscL [Ruminiclostridium herbifermentans]|uniref:Large-conductance mechanosensitive channel n=1 Tax=Ruminiclostridium herbifermentans TaxID=2488810 RepID=A0A4U7JLL2_9FIRM|nr:large-conductance mechanosensitive channel protein MscL [Ruminiclostridium herbifermentans]QNU68207.1 large-conductance mechanosensitive channel protein MscL [Ruminiclostridium herbifermentans]